MSFTNKKSQKKAWSLLLFALAISGFLFLFSPSKAGAATLTVNSADDSAVDSDGDCTLREAIENANNGGSGDVTGGDCAAGVSGSDTINFAITSGGATFTNQGQTGYTISLSSALPDISEAVIINGYSQDQTGSSAQVNTNPSPNPFNGILLIQIDGSALSNGTNGFKFNGGSSGAANSAVRGLIINGFGGGNAISIDANSVVIQGNYIGINPAGTSAATTAEANLTAVTSDTLSGNPHDDVLIGGTDPEDRNILSGQTGSASYPVDGWIIQGNYIGLGANGITEIPNSTATTPGALSVDNCSGVLIGGTVAGAKNVISGNDSYGIAPEGATEVTIQGNLIGTDYTGTVAKPNSVGILTGGVTTNTLIGGTTSSARNIISGNTIAGVMGSATGVVNVQGNYIGLDIQGADPLGNAAGVLVAGDYIVGGSSAGRNIISGNTQVNATIQSVLSATTGAEISYNYIGTSPTGEMDTAITSAQGEGVRISANTSKNLVKSNIIAGNRGNGVAVRSFRVNDTGIPVDVTVSPTDNAILGNHIYANNPGGPIASAQGLGIDIYTAESASLVVYDVGDATVFSNLGPNTPQDPSDSDTGPNNYMNFPVLNSATQEGTKLTVDLNLDAADTTDSNGNYRVEFFANDAADASGYGEGQTYLGYADVSNGNNKTATVTLANGTNLTGKVLSATTTAMNSTTTSGFGATSEFSQTKAVTVLSITTTSGGGLGETGKYLLPVSAAALVFVGSTSSLLRRLYRRQLYRLGGRI